MYKHVKVFLICLRARSTAISRADKFSPPSDSTTLAKTFNDLNPRCMESTS